MTTSTDGLTWTPVVRIPIDPITSTVDHFIPGIGVDTSWTAPNAHLALTYYYNPVASCSPSTCQLSVGYVYDFATERRLKFGVGGLVSRYSLPSDLDSAYGSNPTSYMLFARVKIQ